MYFVLHISCGTSIAEDSMTSPVPLLFRKRLVVVAVRSLKVLTVIDSAL